VVVDSAPVVARAPAGLRERVASLPTWAVLTALVAGSMVARVAAALAHSAPRLFPDEYIYASLARSLAHGSLTIRGKPAHFPALLEPLAAAPLTVLGDPETTYRLTQGLHAAAVSLAAVPVYLLARRVGLSARSGLLCAVLTLLLPTLVYASYVTADALALPLALGAVTAGVAALERPSARSQLAFLGLAVLASATRVQYVVLPAAFVVAALVVERGSLRRTLRQQRLVFILLALPALALVATGPSRVLGYYSTVLDLGVDPEALAKWVATDSMLLCYAAGWVLVPLAFVGLAFGLGRPEQRAERAFAGFAASLVAMLLGEAALYATNGSERFQERYLIALLPLVPVLACLGARRLDRRGARVALAVLAGILFIVAATVPLSEYTQLSSKQDSPLLWAVSKLEETLGSGGASLAVSLAAAALAGLVALAAWRPRNGVPAVFASAAIALALTAGAAVALDIELSNRVVRTFSGPSPSWIDDARVGRVSILQTPFSSRAGISQQLFWNTSIDRILHLPDSSEVDAYGSVPTRIAADGRIVADGRTVQGPLLVEEYASWATLDGAALVRRTAGSALWRPEGTPRMAAMLAGRYLDGWLGALSTLTIWPNGTAAREGAIRLTLGLPRGVPETTVDLRAPGFTRALTIAPGSQTVVEIPFRASKPWVLSLRSRRPFVVSGGRFVGVVSSPPVFVSRSANEA
jgi:hypothetical protein